MTQPPDDQERRPDDSGSGDATAPEDQPTIAWTPPGSVPDTPPADATASDATPSDTTPGEPSLGEDTARGASTPPDEPPPPEPEAAAWESAPPPLSPIISASPAVPLEAAGGQLPPAAAGPLVGWETPGPAVAAPGREGYVVAGMGARLVAYFMDSVLVAIVPTILTLLVIDYAGMIQQAIDAQETGTQATFVMAVTPELILVTLIGVAIQFMYFVGFWTSGSRATLGMRGLRMQVVDAATGGTMSLTAATKRFIAMGFALSLLILVPALQSAAGVAQFALSLFLFFTAITNDRRQGLHDKWANSLVIRSTTSGDGATLVGCLLLIVIVVGFGIIVSAAALTALGPQLEELMREMENSV